MRPSSSRSVIIRSFTPATSAIRLFTNPRPCPFLVQRMRLPYSAGLGYPAYTCLAEESHIVSKVPWTLRMV